ncbi:SRPBCC family protein [Tunturiibacter empetritectus]|nr:SRPBCC family protein [Edaphobacter lichenicola]
MHPSRSPFEHAITDSAMRRTFHSGQWLPYPVELVFAFFSNPDNLPRLMLPWQKARIEKISLAPPPTQPVTSNSITAGAGTRLTLSFRPFAYSPIRVSWDAEISEFAWNDHFCDQQLRGPFAYWHHCHHVKPQTRTELSGSVTSGTLLEDEVNYELPMGKLGTLANSLFVTSQLRSTFAYRHARTSELLAHLTHR